MRKLLSFLICLLLIGISPLYAGTLEDTGAPTDSASRMYTLQQIYNRLNSGTAAVKPATGFVEPLAGPVAGTMKTLDEILDDFNADVTTISASAATAADVASGKKFFATTGTTRGTNWGPVTGSYTPPASFVGLPKTTQTSVFHAASGNDLGDDATVSAGYPGKGVAETISRWTLNPNSDPTNITVKDNATSLTWMRRGDMPVAANETESGGSVTAAGNWAAAFTYVATLNAAVYGGYSDWRVPNIKELQSIVNYQVSNTAIYRADTIPASGYFTATQSDYYWSSTTSAGSTGSAWVVRFGNGYVSYGHKGLGSYCVRAVRGGQ